MNSSSIQISGNHGFNQTQTNFSQYDRQDPVESKQQEQIQRQINEKLSFTRSSPQFFPKAEQLRIQQQELMNNTPTMRFENEKINKISKIYTTNTRNKYEQQNSRRVVRKYPESVEKKFSPIASHEKSDIDQKYAFKGSAIDSRNFNIHRKITKNNIPLSSQQRQNEFHRDPQHTLNKKTNNDKPGQKQTISPTLILKRDQIGQAIFNNKSNMQRDDRYERQLYSRNIERVNLINSIYKKEGSKSKGKQTGPQNNFARTEPHFHKQHSTKELNSQTEKQNIPVANSVSDRKILYESINTKKVDDCSKRRGSDGFNEFEKEACDDEYQNDQFEVMNEEDEEQCSHNNNQQSNRKNTNNSSNIQQNTSNKEQKDNSYIKISETQFNDCNEINNIQQSQQTNCTIQTQQTLHTLQDEKQITENKQDEKKQEEEQKSIQKKPKSPINRPNSNQIPISQKNEKIQNNEQIQNKPIQEQSYQQICIDKIQSYQQVPQLMPTDLYEQQQKLSQKRPKTSEGGRRRKQIRAQNKGEQLMANCEKLITQRQPNRGEYQNINGDKVISTAKIFNNNNNINSQQIQNLKSNNQSNNSNIQKLDTSLEPKITESKCRKFYDSKTFEIQAEKLQFNYDKDKENESYNIKDHCFKSQNEFYSQNHEEMGKAKLSLKSPRSQKKNMKLHDSAYEKYQVMYKIPKQPEVNQYADIPVNNQNNFEIHEMFESDQIKPQKTEYSKAAPKIDQYYDAELDSGLEKFEMDEGLEQNKSDIQNQMAKTFSNNFVEKKEKDCKIIIRHNKSSGGRRKLSNKNINIPFKTSLEKDFINLFA